MEESYYVYIVTNVDNTTLYIGVTNDLIKRIYEHKNNSLVELSSRKNLGKLIYYESYNDINEAVKRKKRLKKWNRAWKENLINVENPGWVDLYANL